MRERTVLRLHTYRYFPYELELAKRELSVITGIEGCELESDRTTISTPVPIPDEALNRLTYFSHVGTGGNHRPTVQHLLEVAAKDGSQNQTNRQSTRYSTHGLHEYKGKFNPQIATSLLTLLGADQRSKVLDPFCGSGTCLVEAEQKRIPSVGLDLNPLAVEVSNSKIELLSFPAKQLKAVVKEFLRNFRKNRPRFKFQGVNDPRITYLKSWFLEPYLSDIECLKSEISRVPSEEVQRFLTISVSNLLRDYSEQEPADLRIRRRKAPYPEIPLIEQFEQRVSDFIEVLTRTQEIIDCDKVLGKAFIADSRVFSQVSSARKQQFRGKFTHVITSPPYATALPYIDTQRLSLIWMGAIAPENILTKDSELVGSREIRGQKKTKIEQDLLRNANHLPQSIHDYCLKLNNSIGDGDGFRRRAVPALLYRYYSGMFQVLQCIRDNLVSEGMVAMVIGGNRTTLGGIPFNIQTPEDVATLGEASKFRIHEIVPLQTYQRFGIHAQNAVKTESVVILKK